METPPSATDLRVEGRLSPVTVDTVLPRFSWIPVDPDRGAAQSAYQILVASDPTTLAQDVGDLWDSGWVPSAQTLYIPYDGVALTGSSHCYWKVRIWDETGLEGAWSSTSDFWIGPIGPQWEAEFIWDATANPNDSCYLRKSFVLSAVPSTARVHVFAQNEYHLYLNGVEVGTGPVPCDPTHTAYYDSYDIAPLLQPGENVFAARVHAIGVPSGSHVLTPPAFLLQAELEPGAAGAMTIVSDASWHALEATPYDEGAPIRGPSYAQATAVEDFDARLEPLGWMLPGFDDSSWAPATVSKLGYRLTPRTIPRRMRLAPLSPVSISEPVPGIHVVDFGENRAGWPRLTLRGVPAGTRVTLWYSEELVGGRIVRDRDEITNNWDAYTARGDAVEVFEPDSGFNGMRYMELEGLPGPLAASDIEFQPVTTLDERTGSFSSTDPNLEVLWDISLRTRENTTQGLWLDGPQREQAQYSADAYIQIQSHAYLSRETAHAKKFLVDLAQSDLAGGGGVLRDRYPTDSTKVIPEWSLFWVLGLWESYFLTADPRLLSRHYGLVQSLLNSMDAFRDPATDLLTNVPGAVYQWKDLDTSGAARTPMNCLYVGALEAAARIANLLGRPGDAQAFLSTRALVQQGIQTHLFDGVRRYRDSLGSSQYHAASSTLALSMGVTPPGFESAVLGYLETFPFGPESAPASYLYFRILSRFDRTDSILSRMTPTAGPWSMMLSSGATTTWEIWLPTASRCHGWYSFPTQLFADTIVGIQPLSVGFSTFRIRPHLGGLTDAQAVVPTVRGDIQARWLKQKGRAELILDVPANTNARVELPRTGLKRLKLRSKTNVLYEYGQFFANEAGVSLLQIDADYISLSVEPGHYDFVLTGLPVGTSELPSPVGGRRP